MINMGMTIKELRIPSQPIAKEFKDRGFTMKDLASIGMLLINEKNLDAQDISEIVKLFEDPETEKLAPRKIVELALKRSQDYKQNWSRKTLKNG
jgi:hypothetical protein